MMNKFGTIGILLSSAIWLNAQTSDNINRNKFKQLKSELATPTAYRNAAGSPGHEYYQNLANYLMDIELDEEKQTLTGKETITYKNNSPDQLSYLWVQLDQNIRSKTSDSKKIRNSNFDRLTSIGQLSSLHNDFDGGFKIERVADASGKKIDYTINKTMMRIELQKPLAPGKSFTFKIDWWYNINRRTGFGTRSGYEFFESDSNSLYGIAQFYPRMCVYNETEGWQNKQFLGRGEFALPFGDFQVNITVPADHIVASTGKLQNGSKVLSKNQLNRLNKAKKSDSPIFIVTKDEAAANAKDKSNKKKTWTFKAKNVRDFAFASSRKFIWDAQNVKLNSKNVLAMSFYPDEGNPIWQRYSTRAVAHTLRCYSKYTFDYPYPVAISVNMAKIGMEYPMICFNFGRVESDSTYSAKTKYGMISVIIHEVGHNYFPMIVNSDERQWTWMDEGLNTFLQYLTEQEWERNYPSRRGPAHKIADYMAGSKDFISPIMTNSESIHQFGNNAYGKPATALNILRETVMGRELFDYAFKQYAQQWMFKHPTPADFFRVMEDASGIDLDWFWRGWFYSTDHVDIGIKDVKLFSIDLENPKNKSDKLKEEHSQSPVHVGQTRNKTAIPETVMERHPELRDFYNKFDPLDATILDQKEYEEYVAKLTEGERKLLEKGGNYYQIDFENVGGLVMPLILEFSFEDGTKQEQRIPAEIWKLNNFKVSKIFFFDKKIASISLDPHLETADTDFSNNHWPRKHVPSRFELFKANQNPEDNPMRRAKRILKK